MKELMFVKINNCSDRDIDEIYKISKTFYISVFDYSPATVLIESGQTIIFTNGGFAVGEYIAGCEFFNMLLQFYFSRTGIHISL